jgi:hypothetical protein
MQQQDDKPIAKAPRAMKVVIRRNILKMLEMRVSLAIKKTMTGKFHEKTLATFHG